MSELDEFQNRRAKAKSEERFPKAKLIDFKWHSVIKIRGRYWLRPIYMRMSNAASLDVIFFTITWRMPWLPEAAFSMGWDACWRQQHELHSIPRRFKEKEIERYLRDHRFKGR